MSDPYKPNETAIEDALAKYRAGKVGLGGFPSYLFPPPSLPPVRKPVDPQFRIDRLSLQIRRLELEIEATRIDLKEAMFDAGQLGPEKTDAKIDTNVDTAIAALEPAPAEPAGRILIRDEDGLALRFEAPALADPPSAELRSVPGAEENAGTNSELPDGFLPWQPFFSEPPKKDLVVEGLFEDGSTELNTFEIWERQAATERGLLIAYRILPEQDVETHTDGVRTAEGETVAGDDRVETQSVTTDPAFLAAVERAEATLAAAEPAYVGLQDTDLDAEYEAMREREKADKPKLHFSIFGERGNRKLEGVE